MPTTDEIEHALRALLSTGDLRQPDEIEHHDEATILALWPDRKLTVVLAAADDGP